MFHLKRKPVRNSDEKLAAADQLCRTTKKNFALPSDGLHSAGRVDPHRRLDLLCRNRGNGKGVRTVPENCVSPTPRS